MAYKVAKGGEKIQKQDSGHPRRHTNNDVISLTHANTHTFSRTPRNTNSFLNYLHSIMSGQFDEATQVRALINLAET